MAIKKCKTEACELPARYMYCKACGGRRRAELEGLLPSNRPKKTRHSGGQVPKGQAVPHGQGIGGKTKPNREVREVKRKARQIERAKKSCRKGSTSKIEIEGGSKDALRRKRKAQKKAARGKTRGGKRRANKARKATKG